MSKAARVARVLLGMAWGVVLGFINLFKWWFPGPFSKSVRGEVVVLTGGGSGIGRLVSLRLAALGATVVTVDVNKKGNDETVRLIHEAGGEARGYECDLSKKEAVYAVAEAIKADVGPVTMLVNNAGIVAGNRILDVPDEKIELTFKVNTLAHFWTLKAFLGDMLEKKHGHIVNVASMAGLFGNTKLVDYCASKFAAVGLGESLQVELNRYGDDHYIAHTIIEPYYINTGMFTGVASPLLPIQDPDDVADQIVTGILTEATEVMCPWYGKYILICKAIFPTKAYLDVANAFGVSQSMDEFTGRAGDHKKAD